MGCHPNVDLLKTRLEPFLESKKELAAIRQIGDVDKNAEEIVTVRLALMAPEPANHLRLRRDGAESPLQLKQSVRYVLVGDRLPVIEPEREEEFVSPV